VDNSTNQGLNRMTVRHRLFGAVVSTLIGLSAYVLAAQEVDETDESTSIDQATTSSDVESEQNSELVEDQLTKEFLQEQTKDEFTEYMLNLEQYSANDQNLIKKEYARRCADESDESSSDLCPDVYYSWGDVESVEDQIEPDLEDSDDEQSMPRLEETSVEVRVAELNESTENVTDPRRNNKPSDNKNGSVPTWRNK